MFSPPCSRFTLQYMVWTPIPALGIPTSTLQVSRRTPCLLTTRQGVQRNSYSGGPRGDGMLPPSSRILHHHALEVIEDYPCNDNQTWEVFDPETLAVPECTAVYSHGDQYLPAVHDEVYYHHVVEVPEIDTRAGSAQSNRQTLVVPAFRSVPLHAPARRQSQYQSAPSSRYKHLCG